MRFRLITWNMHKGIGGIDRKYRIDRIVQTLNECTPDVVHLQEVDDDVPRSRHHRQVDLLAEALGLPHRAYQRNVSLRRGAYGNAILSRFALGPCHDLDLSLPFKKRRRAQIASCSIPTRGGSSRPLLLVNLHLGLMEFEQRIQLRRIVENESVVESIDEESGLIVAGDMNDVFGRLGRQLLEPIGFHSACTGRKTFPAFMPMRALDQIYYRGHLKLHRCFISASPVARQASDHLPLVADFDIPAKP